MHEIQLPQGTIRYRDEGTGPTLVFVHGALVSGTLWRDVVAPLAADHRCIVPDWPLGSHELPMRRDADLSPAGVAAIVASFLEALDLRDVTIVANDSGGAISQLVVTRYPERVGKLVLTPCDAFDRFPPPDFEYLTVVPKIPGLGATILKLMHWFPGLAASKYGFGTIAKHGFDREQLKAWIRPAATNRAIRRDVMKFLRGVDKSVTLDVAEQLPGVSMPALIVWATEDKHFPLSYGERLRDTLPNATLVRVDDSYAFAPLDQPGAVADAIRDFHRTAQRRPHAADEATRAVLTAS